MHRIHRHTIHRINYYLLLLDNILLCELWRTYAELKSLERKARLFFTQPFIDMKIEVILT